MGQTMGIYIAEYVKVITKNASIFVPTTQQTLRCLFSAPSTVWGSYSCAWKCRFVVTERRGAEGLSQSQSHEQQSRRCRDTRRGTAGLHRRRVLTFWGQTGRGL